MGRDGLRAVRMKKQVAFSFLLAIVILTSSCFFNTSSTTVRGYVHYDGKPVSGADVRLTASGAEATTTTGLDGRFTISLKHRSTQMLEIKVLRPGFVHDKVEFPGFAAPEEEIKIGLKKLFTIPSTR